MVPSIAAVSILGWFPQSAQYIRLMNRAESLSLHRCYHKWIYFAPPQSRSPSLRVDHDCVRLVNHAGDESFPVMRPADMGHLDDVSTGVGPVQVSCHPVHSDPTRHLQIRNLNTKKTKKKTKNIRTLQDGSFGCVPHVHTYLHVCHPRVGLSTVAIAVGRERGGRQIVGRNAPRVPVGPVDAICLDVDVHGVDAHVSIALENLLITPVWYGRVQAADFIVIGDIQKLSLSYGGIKKIKKNNNNNNIVVGTNKQAGKETSSPSALQVSLILVKYLWQLHL